MFSFTDAKTVQGAFFLFEPEYIGDFRRFRFNPAIIFVP
jgi:hypothetical protein